jgi:outer membrane protein assembly factor BamD
MKSKTLRWMALGAGALLLVALWGCKAGTTKDPILKLSAEESLAQGKDFLAKKNYGKARPLFTHAFEVEPNSKVGREGLLLAADTYYLEGGPVNYTSAEAKYRDYLNRFPTSDQASYVQFQIANSLAKRMARADRDQATARKCMEAYQELIRLYPTSEYATKAQEQIEVVNANLAEHEYLVGHFYLRYGVPVAAIGRFVHLLATYPKYTHMDQVIFELGVAYQHMSKNDDARKTFDRLRTEYPNSKLIKNIPAPKTPPAQKSAALGKAT